MKTQIIYRLAVFFMAVFTIVSSCDCEKEKTPAPASTEKSLIAYTLTLGWAKNTTLDRYVSITAGAGNVAMYNSSNAEANCSVIDFGTGYWLSNEIGFFAPTKTSNIDSDNWDKRKGSTFAKVLDMDKTAFGNIRSNAQLAALAAQNNIIYDTWQNLKVGGCFIVRSFEGTLAIGRVTNMQGNNSDPQSTVTLELKVQQ